MVQNMQVYSTVVEQTFRNSDLGIVAIDLYAAVMMTIVFQLIKHTIGLRTTAEEEIIGMDISEHGLASAYPDFVTSYNEKRSM